VDILEYLWAEADLHKHLSIGKIGSPVFSLQISVEEEEVFRHQYFQPEADDEFDVLAISIILEKRLIKMLLPDYSGAGHTTILTGMTTW